MYEAALPIIPQSWGTYYCKETQTGKQESLQTAKKLDAIRLVSRTRAAACGISLDNSRGRVLVFAE